MCTQTIAFSAVKWVVTKPITAIVTSTILSIGAGIMIDLFINNQWSNGDWALKSFVTSVCTLAFAIISDAAFWFLRGKYCASDDDREDERPSWFKAKVCIVETMGFVFGTLAGFGIDAISAGVTGTPSALDDYVSPAVTVLARASVRNIFFFAKSINNFCCNQTKPESFEHDHDVPSNAPLIQNNV